MPAGITRVDFVNNDWIEMTGDLLTMHIFYVEGAPYVYYMDISPSVYGDYSGQSLFVVVLRQKMVSYSITNAVGITVGAWLGGVRIYSSDKFTGFVLIGCGFVEA